MSPTDAPKRHTEGRPIVRRFVIKRLPLAILSDRPWKVRDRSRPAYLGHAESLEKAIEIVDRKLADEGRGYLRDVDTARAAWMREVNA